MYISISAVFQDYLAHIIDMSNLPIRPEQVCALFGNIEDIYEFNRWVQARNTNTMRSTIQFLSFTKYGTQQSKLQGNHWEYTN